MYSVDRTVENQLNGHDSFSTPGSPGSGLSPFRRFWWIQPQAGPSGEAQSGSHRPPRTVSNPVIFRQRGVDSVDRQAKVPLCSMWKRPCVIPAGPEKRTLDLISAETRGEERGSINICSIYICIFKGLDYGKCHRELDIIHAPAAQSKRSQ